MAGLFPVVEGGRENLKTKWSDFKKKSCDWEMCGKVTEQGLRDATEFSSASMHLEAQAGCPYGDTK